MAFTTEIAGELYGVAFLLKPPMEWAMKQVWDTMKANAKEALVEEFSIPEAELVYLATQKANAYWYADLNDPEIRARPARNPAAPRKYGHGRDPTPRRLLPNRSTILTPTP
jgi:hypothetical protein